MMLAIPSMARGSLAFTTDFEVAYPRWEVQVADDAEVAVSDDE
jgi:hypothetical protein